LPVIVVILSSSKDEEDIATAYRLGANGFLVKPPDVGKLLNMAKSIKDFWLTQNTPPPESHAEELGADRTHRLRRETLDDPSETFLNMTQSAL
jgi:DNA-binding NarL/FixJ family response regulator